MRTFGRVMGVVGLGLVVLGSAGAIAMLPPPVVDHASGYIEESRQALRQQLPDMPDLQELVAGIPVEDCIPAEFADASQGEATCAAEDPPGDPADMLKRSNEAALRFRAPAPAEGATAQD